MGEHVSWAWPGVTSRRQQVPGFVVNDALMASHDASNRSLT